MKTFTEFLSEARRVRHVFTDFDDTVAKDVGAKGFADFTRLVKPETHKSHFAFKVLKNAAADRARRKARGEKDLPHVGIVTARHHDAVPHLRKWLKDSGIENHRDVHIHAVGGDKPHRKVAAIASHIKRGRIKSGHEVHYFDDKAKHVDAVGGMGNEHSGIKFRSTRVGTDRHEEPKKKTVKEDIEMADVAQKPNTTSITTGFGKWKKKSERENLKPSASKRLGKGYTMHTVPSKDPDSTTHHIVHDDSDDVVGEIETLHRGGEHTVTHTRIHGVHTKKKIGKSLALSAYKHLAKTRTLKSSALQSPGGASIWNRLRKDPKMKGRVFHRSESGEVPAHDVPEKRIWARSNKVEKSKGTPESLPPSKHHAKEHEKVLASRLVIRPLKKS
jgi:hypothetical protein